MDRRRFLRNSAKASLGLLGTGGLTGLYTWKVEPFWLDFVQQDMPIRNLPAALEGKTLMQLSDLHVGNRFDYAFLIHSMQKAQALEPDIVVYTGDYVSYEDETQLGQLQEVMAHAVTGKMATVGILGNHDYGYRWEQEEVALRIRDRLEAAGIRVLRNEAMDASGLNIIGMDDWWANACRPERAMASYDPSAANLVLCHNPDVCDLDVWQGYQGWILSGHTHGGQCKPPFLDPPIIPVRNKRYTAGAIDLHDGRMLYINRALGHLRQVRFNVRPEITVFRMLKA
jgi:predicted MPP superfamily phosphohydrolase